MQKPLLSYCLAGILTSLVLSPAFADSLDPKPLPHGQIVQQTGQAQKQQAITQTIQSTEQSKSQGAQQTKQITQQLKQTESSITNDMQQIVSSTRNKE